MKTHVVDSSAWLEYFADGPAADHFAPIIEQPASLIVPAITLYEVFKRIAAQRDENNAIACLAVMQRGRTVAIDDSLALFAAQLSLRHKLPMADSLIYATAHLAKADLWTMDVDFQGLAGVHYISKSSSSGA